MPFETSSSPTRSSSPNTAIFSSRWGRTFSRAWPPSSSSGSGSKRLSLLRTMAKDSPSPSSPRLILMISFNYFMVYNYPSFYGLVTDQADEFATRSSSI